MNFTIGMFGNARILDCWRVYLGGKDGNLLEYFETAENKQETLIFEELYEMARIPAHEICPPHVSLNAFEGTLVISRLVVAALVTWHVMAFQGIHGLLTQ